MKITILVDNPSSWMVPYALGLKSTLLEEKHDVCLIHSHDEIERGDVLVLLSCERLLKRIDLNKHNIVVHASDLPYGKGWSPLTWQILEGKNDIPVTLFEADETIDTGEIYFQDWIHFEGHELVDEMRASLAKVTLDLVLKFIRSMPNVVGKAQPEGVGSSYGRRRPKDSELDIHKSIDSQFNLFRVSDNEKYPAYFVRNGVKYILEIRKEL